MSIHLFETYCQTLVQSLEDLASVLVLPLPPEKQQVFIFFASLIVVVSK